MKSLIYPNTWFNPSKKELEAFDITAPIAFDMDGVLSETGIILAEEIKSRFGVSEIRQQGLGYETFKYVIPGANERVVFDTINEVIQNESLSALPTPWMEKVMEYWYDVLSLPVTVVTARVQDNMAVTYEWLHSFMPCPFNLIMVNGMQKEVVLKTIGCQCFVDDRYKTINTLTSHIAMPILYRQPWNQGRPVPASRFEIDDLRDMIPLFNITAGSRIMNWPRNIPYPNRIGEKGKYLDLYA